MSALHHLLHIAGHPPPDLPDVGVVLLSLLSQQDLVTSRRELGHLLGRAGKLGRAQGDEAEGALEGCN